jgi:hypothetical protein
MFNNKELERAVLEELSWEPSVDSAHIVVSGRTPVSWFKQVALAIFTEKYSAERATLRVKGVKAVAEEIEVWRPSGFKQSDEEIAAAALDRISWDVRLLTWILFRGHSM